MDYKTIIIATIGLLVAVVLVFGCKYDYIEEEYTVGGILQ